MKEVKYPRIGIGVMIQNNEKRILLGHRQGSHGEDTWCFPGGHLEFGETLFECAAREVKEETGLEISEFELVAVYDEFEFIDSDNKHYINIGIRGVYAGGAPRVIEADKCLEWKWFNPKNLPGDLFPATKATLERVKIKKIYN